MLSRPSVRAGRPDWMALQEIGDDTGVAFCQRVGQGGHGQGGQRAQETVVTRNHMGVKPVVAIPDQRAPGADDAPLRLPRGIGPFGAP